tara:strand:+ start:13168 stop:13461 length:294 start_codon:yes stop_codon:yes gene_type:complete
MTNNIDKLAEEIFEANDDLPQSVNGNTTIWIGVIEFKDGQHRPVIGFSEDDLYRKSLGRGRLVWTDYYDNARDILEDSVQDLWDYAYDRAEKRSVKQ